MPVSEQEKPKRRERKRQGWAMSQGKMDACREVIRENIDYGGFVRERPYNAAQLDEMVEAACSKRETIRVSGNNFPQVVAKERLLKLNRERGT